MISPSSSSRRFTAAVIAITVLAAPALAQSSAPTSADSVGATADISGYWEFETKRYDYGCKMTGEMTIQPGADEGEYVGQLIAREKCDSFVFEDGSVFPGINNYAEQTVRATREGAMLTIVATIVVLRPSTSNYQPDDFVLEIVDGGLMLGELRSADIAEVAFFRGDLPIA